MLECSTLSPRAGWQPSVSPLLVVGAAILLPVVAALPHATLQASNIVVFWKQQVLTLFKPTRDVGSLFPSRAESQSESHLNRTPCNKALLGSNCAGGCGTAACCSERGEAARQGTNSITGLRQPLRSSVWWLPLQGTLRHFLKFLPRRIISE